VQGGEVGFFGTGSGSAGIYLNQETNGKFCFVRNQGIRK